MQRARKAEDRAFRREALLDAARALFATSRYRDVKMVDVARLAEVAKGTVFLYFPTKESLFLALFEDELVRWADDLASALSRTRSRSPSGIASIIVASLKGRDAFTRLLPLVDHVLEENVAVEQIIALKTNVVRKMLPLAAIVEERLELSPRSGGPLLLEIYAMLLGLVQLSDPCPAARAALEQPHLAPLVLSLEAALGPALTRLLKGASDG